MSNNTFVSLSDQFTIIAHRFGPGDASQISGATENSLRLLVQAGTEEWNVVECDVWVVRGVPFVIHGPRLEPHTENGTGRIDMHSPEYLFELETKGGWKIPRLDEVLDYLAPKMQINIELKGSVGEDVVLGLLEDRLEKELLTPDRILISSFNHQMLSRIRQLGSSLKLAPLTSSWYDSLVPDALSLDAFAINIDVGIVDHQIVRAIHGAGMKVFVFTVNELDDLKLMQSMGVDGIFTDYPKRFLSKLRDG